jgi:hypothetical protein
MARRARVAGVASAAAIALASGSAAFPDSAGPAPKRALNSVSFDRATIWQDEPDQTTTLTIVSVSRQIGERTSLFCRLGMVHDRSTVEPRAWGVSNPAAGATLQLRLPGRLELGLVLGTTLPIGSGGGDTPTRPDALRAMLNGTDWGGPMFGPNHLDLFEGLRLAASLGRLTVRLRSTLHPALRVRGERNDSLGRWVVFTSSGLSATCALGRMARVLGELAETRFLNHPPFLGQAPGDRSDHYAVAGLALALGVGGGRELRPTVSVARAVDAPKNRRDFRLVEVELALAF